MVARGFSKPYCRMRCGRHCRTVGNRGSMVPSGMASGIPVLGCGSVAEACNRFGGGIGVGIVAGGLRHRFGGPMAMLDWGPHIAGISRRFAGCTDGLHAIASRTGSCGGWPWRKNVGGGVPDNLAAPLAMVGSLSRGGFCDFAERRRGGSICVWTRH